MTTTESKAFRIPDPATLISMLWKYLHTGSALLGLLTPLLIFGGYSVVTGNGDESQTISGEIVTVERRDITLSIKALGTVTLANEQQLRFNQLGKVANVYMQEGDQVKRDDLIAELDKIDPLADIRQAQLNVEAARLQLENQEASRAQQILSAQNSVRSTERQLTDSYGSLPATRQQVESAIEQAKRTVAEKEAAAKKAERDMSVSIESSLASADDLLDDLYGLLNGESRIRGNTRYNREFVIDFLYNDFNLKNQTEFAFYDATNAYEDLRSAYPDIIHMTETKELSKVLSSAITLADEVKKFADLTYQFVLTAVPSAGYTDADINTLKTSANTARSSAITLVDTLRDQQALLSGQGTSTAQKDLQSAKESLATLELQLKNGTTSADDMERTIESLNDSLRNQQAQLEQTKTNVEVNINQQKNTLAQRVVALQKTQRALENYELRAPFDGVIRRVDFQVGDNLLADAGETKYVVIDNPDRLIITVQLDQVDVVNVKEGQRATIAFDALPNQTFEGTVDFIDTTPIAQSGVVSYEVKISLEQTDATILSGMTATVEIITEQRTAVLAAPNLALLKQNEMTFVRLENGQSTPVETGVTDGRYTEVISGLNEGDRIQSINVSITTEGQQNNQNQQPSSAQMMMRTGGGGFRPR
ncbi:efflux RND transporter periplasmic adaptor subunit [Patescibacteria group bacterium]|nr:efflux RND transporter periplasmic adaptor subunit [Patescibacteria group bacterium]MBU2259361.1 efflux RND transporter periplasmic adaptor subunit [Patescibacteria group bacterium]